jgi:hypothetical protein
VPSNAAGTKTNCRNTRPGSQSSRPQQHNSFSTMLVKKCDNCKKEIKEGDDEVVVGLGWPNYSFYTRCGKPIIAFLKKQKLLPSTKTTR